MDKPKTAVKSVVTQGVDKYTADIDLCNACRSFYVSRLKAADKLKHKLSGPGRDRRDSQSSKALTYPRKKNSIDVSMDILRRELASLVDLDLALMRQLLTLNEQIEDLKWQRKYHSEISRTSLSVSSCLLDSSVCTLSDTDWDREQMESKYPTPSSLSIYRDFYSTQDTLNLDYDSHTEAPSFQTSTSDLGSSDDTANSVSELSKTGRLFLHGGSLSTPSELRMREMLSMSSKSNSSRMRSDTDSEDSCVNAITDNLDHDNLHPCKASGHSNTSHMRSGAQQAETSRVRKCVGRNCHSKSPLTDDNTKNMKCAKEKYSFDSGIRV